ncbi:MAG: esterase-like activity of phytase family protein [Hyphomonadaceae bacterium]|nr:esterase-like activity of phytase family protein [Hyphomonadaceae bacterium]
MKALLALAAMLCVSACFGPPRDHWRQTEAWRRISVEAKPVRVDEDRYGALTFRGGIELTSRDRAFGGLSDLSVGADGALIAISDSGMWLRAQLQSDETGAPRALSGVRLAVLRDERGRRFKSGATRDSEGLARLSDGRLAVSYERETRVLVHDLDALGPTAAGARGPRLRGVEDLHPNTTLEAITQLRDGRLLIGAERDAHGYAPFWITPLDAQAPVATIGRLKLPFGYGLSGMALLPDGDVVALIRAYGPVVGAYARLLRLDGAALEQGIVRATPLAQLRAPLPLDNFEGVAAAALPGGGARLYLVSDDNYMPTQRTLLYVFDLTPPQRPRRASS